MGAGREKGPLPAPRQRGICFFSPSSLPFLSLLFLLLWLLFFSSFRSNLFFGKRKQKIGERALRILRPGLPPTPPLFFLFFLSLCPPLLLPSSSFSPTPLERGRKRRGKEKRKVLFILSLSLDSLSPSLGRWGLHFLSRIAREFVE